jgi:hypothetical protein
MSVPCLHTHTHTHIYIYIYIYITFVVEPVVLVRGHPLRSYRGIEECVLMYSVLYFRSGAPSSHGNPTVCVFIYLCMYEYYTEE